ncbi:BSD-domain-containing protein [Ramaria rubella]|nr:BSD-domain-containing protein [Ramaria rubella]
MASDIICRAKASYKKIPGLLELSSTHLQWSQDGKKGVVLKVPYVQAASLFCSKEGAAQVRLKLGVVGDDQGHNFTFTAPPPAATQDREVFKRELSSIISRNRAALENASGPPSFLPTPVHAGFGRPPQPLSRGSTPGSMTPTAGASGSPEDFRLRKKVLLKTPELAALHLELVVAGQITEAEFWEGREHLLQAEVSIERQKRGKPGQIVDPRPTDQPNGERKIMVTPQMVHDIFEEHPVVAKAYNENVPNQLSEGEFWKRYFQSKLFDSHRASIRSAAAQNFVKEDPIFDKYLEKVDDGLEPRKQRNEGVDLFVDLAATQEDHPQTGNERDVTMQAGKQRNALPLIRRFNQHSERLLNSALGGVPAAKRRRVDSPTDPASRYDAIDLDDLHDSQASEAIALEMKDRQRYFEGTASGDTANGTQADSVDIAAILVETRNNLHDWSRNLGSMKLDNKASAIALASMTQNVTTRLEVKKRTNDIPESLLRQMTTCQTAGNEFLRQFWSAIYPPSSDLQTLATASPAHKAAKADRMADYLSRTPAKVDALIHMARQEGADVIKVQVALQPLLDAVEKALHFYRTRKPPR